MDKVVKCLAVKASLLSEGLNSCRDSEMKWLWQLNLWRRSIPLHQDLFTISPVSQTHCLACLSIDLLHFLDCFVTILM